MTRRFVAFNEATVWRCDRLVRSFESTEIKPDGSRAFSTYDVRTPSCAHRFRLDVAPRARVGRHPRVVIVDQWGIGGIDTRLCVTSPRGRSTCRPLSFGDGISFMLQRFHAAKKGVWKIELRVRNHRVRAVVGVSTRPPRVKPAPVILATGDSTMQGSTTSSTIGSARRRACAMTCMPAPRNQPRPGGRATARGKRPARRRDDEELPACAPSMRSISPPPAR